MIEKLDPIIYALLVILFVQLVITFGLIIERGIRENNIKFSILFILTDILFIILCVIIAYICS